MHARDQSSIFSTGGKFRPDYGLLLELHVHALTLVARSYALLLGYMHVADLAVLLLCGERISVFGSAVPASLGLWLL